MTKNPFKRFWSLKKRYKFLTLLGLLIVLLVSILKIAPSIAKGYIESHSQEWIGRQLQIDDISLSVSTFTLSIDNLTLFEQDGKTPFVGFEKFRINLNPTRLIAKKISISEIYLKGLYAQVIQNGEQFNFSDILNHLNSNEPALIDSAQVNSASIDTQQADSAQTKNERPQKTAYKDSSVSDSINISNTVSQSLHGFSLSIDNISIEKSNIVYKDQKVGSKFKLEDFSLQVPALYFSNKDTDIGVNLKFSDGGDLNVKVLFNMETSDFNVLVGLHQFSLAVANPYLKDYLTYKDFNGLLNVDLDVAGNINAPIDSDVKGHVSLEQILLTETSGKNIRLDRVDLGINKANINDMDIQVDSVIVDGVSAHFDLYKNSNNFTTLLKSNSNATFEDSSSTGVDMTDSVVVAEAPVDTTAPKEEPKNTEPAKPLKFALNKLLVKNTEFTANDHTLKKPFSFKVSGITVSGSNINFDTPCAINVSANLPEGGHASLKYKGAFSDLSTMDAYISVKNLALKQFSPYSHHYTGYPISGGTLAFASDNKMARYDIDSKNTIDIYNIDVADKDPNSDPEFNVPMKIGLYILKDKDDKIQFDVPVKGNLQDPEFSYGKIIWKTVMNLLIKVAVSPLKLVGNLANTGAGALGIDMGKNDEVLIDPLNVSFESEQFEKASKIVQAVATDKNLKINFVQSFNLKKTVDAFRTRKLKTEFYKETHNKTSLNELDEKEIIAIDDQDSLFANYVKNHSKDLSRAALEKELMELAQKRNQEMLKVLQQQKGITKKNLDVTTAPRKALLNYRGKSAYKVQLDVQ